MASSAGAAKRQRKQAPAVAIQLAVEELGPRLLPQKDSHAAAATGIGLEGCDLVPLKPRDVEQVDRGKMIEWVVGQVARRFDLAAVDRS